MRRPKESPAEARARRAAVDDHDVVLEAALRFLEARPRSTAEVRGRLTQAGYRPELVEASIERLTSLAMLDDVSFARSWVESRDRAHPRGERALRLELSRKGIDRATLDLVLEERRATSGDEATRATREPGTGAEVALGSDVEARGADRLLARQERALRREADPRRRRARAYALLARHGFDPETAAEAVRRMEGRWAADEAAGTAADDDLGSDVGAEDELPATDGAGRGP